MGYSRDNVAEATLIVGALNEVRTKKPDAMSGDDRVFVTDMHEKLNQYGNGLVVSDRQLNRLRAIRADMMAKGVV